MNLITFKVNDLYFGIRADQFSKVLNNDNKSPFMDNVPVHEMNNIILIDLFHYFNINKQINFSEQNIIIFLAKNKIFSDIMSEFSISNEYAFLFGIIHDFIENEGLTISPLPNLIKKLNKTKGLYGTIFYHNKLIMMLDLYRILYDFLKNNQKN